MVNKRATKLIGQGFYDYAQAASLVGVDTRTLKRWIGEYEGSEPVFDGASPVADTVTFIELMELMFIGMFREQGVPLQTIRAAADAASKKFQTAHPFCVKQFDTDGKTIFATLIKKEADKQIVEDLAKGQLVFENIIRPFFRKIEYCRSDMDAALRYWPLELSGRVVLDPNRKLGQPIDFETGVPTRVLVDAVNSTTNNDLSEVARWFEVPVDAVEAAVKFERSLVS